MLRFVCLISISLFVFLAYCYFSMFLAVWLAFLAIAIYWAPGPGTCLLFLVIAIDTVRPIPGNIYISFSELELSVAVLSWTARELRIYSLKKWITSLDVRILFWAAPFLLAVFLSATINLEWFKVMPHVLRHSEAFVMSVLAVNVFGRQTGRLAVLPYWTIGFAIALYTLVGVVMLKDSNSLASTFANPNQFAGYLSLLVPFVAVRFAFSAESGVRWFWGYLLLLAFLVVFATNSRSALVAASLSLLLMGIACFWKTGGFWVPFQVQTRRRVTPVHIAALGLLVVLVGWWLGGTTGIHRVWESAASSYSTSDLQEAWKVRKNLWTIGASLWAEHPLFGIGPGRYRHEYPRYSNIVEEPVAELLRNRFKDRPWNVPLFIEQSLELLRQSTSRHVHDLYLQLAVNFGIFGLAAFLVFLVLSSRALLEVIPSPLGLAGLGMLGSFAFHNLTDVTFPSLGIEFGWLLGVALSGEKAASLGAERLGSNQSNRGAESG